MRSPPAGASLINNISHKLQSFADAMDSASLASAAASLLGNTLHLQGALYGKWDDSGTPIAERLMYELSQLRTVLQTLESASLAYPEPMLLADMPSVLEESRKCLVSIGLKLLRCGFLSDSLDMENPAWSWEAFDQERQGKKMPWSRNEGESLVTDMQLSISKLRTCIALSPLNYDNELSVKQLNTAKPKGILWSDSADYNEAHASVKSKRAQGTGIWLISNIRFQRWLLIDRYNHILYCPGKPGSGKTILASMVIDEIIKLRVDAPPSNIGIAYFYFNYKKPTPILKVALALVEQLYLQSRTLASEVRQLESRASKSEQISLNDILAALTSTSQRFQKVYIIIDALDECARDYQKDLVLLLTAIEDSHCRLFATSRPYLVFDIFKNAPSIPTKPTKDDISLFVRETLHDNPIFGGGDVALEEKIVEKLADSGSQHGMFLLVHLQLQNLMASHTRSSILNQLNQLQDSLSSVYEGETKRAIEQDPQQEKLAIKTLTWLYSAQRPLGSKELMDVLDATGGGRGKASISAILESCSGLVRLDLTTGDIAFMHYSVHEFFDSYPGKGFLLGEEFIALQCLNYLVRSSHSVSTVEELKDCLNDLPFYSYAVSFWGRHCSHLKDPSPDLIALCRRLLIEEPNLTRALAHLTCQPQVDEFPSENRLFKSSGLHLVCHFGIAWAIPIAVEKLALELKDKRDSTPLHLTAEDGKLLKDEWGRTPLHLAAEDGFPECVEELQKRILLDPLETDQFDKTAYHYAAMNKNPGVLQGLGHPREVLSRDKSSKYPLEYAASRGNVQVTRLLLDMSPSQDALRSALRTALENGKMEVSGTLLEYGAIPDGTHLLIAVKGGFETAVKQLLEYGCAMDDAVDGEGTALHAAARTGRTSILAFLIWHGANLEAEDKQGRTALACAIRKGDSEAVHTLLKAGAEPKVIVDGEEEAVVYAAARGMIDITKLLLEAGTNAKLAAFAAVKHGQYEVLHRLLESGLAPDTSWNGRTLLQEANEAGSKTIEDLVRSAGAPIAPRPVFTFELPKYESKDVVNTSAASQSSVVINEIEPSPHEVAKHQNSPLLSHRDQKSPRRSLSPASPGLETRSETFRPDPVTRPDPAVGVSRGSKSSSYYLLLRDPIMESSLRLGAIVADPSNPLNLYLPRDMNSLDGIVHNALWTDSMYMARSFDQSAKLSAIRSILGINSSKQGKLSVSASYVTHVRLQNHGEVLGRVLTANQRDLSRIICGGKEMYFVVGLMIGRDLAISRSRSTGVSVSATVPLSDVIGAVPVGPGLSAFVETSTGADQRFEGEDVIFAIQYRVLKLRRHSIFSFGARSKELYLDLGDYLVVKPHERVL